MKAIALLLFAAGICQAFGSDTQGSICVAPIPPGPQRTADIPEHFCSSGKLSFRIDSEPASLFPHKASKKIESLDISAKHQVIIFCDDKSHQSFTFQFETFQSTDLCLFINDLYQTAQLWERKASPWCKCK